MASTCNIQKTHDVNYPSNVATTASMNPSPSTSATRIPAALELETVASHT